MLSRHTLAIIIKNELSSNVPVPVVEEILSLLEQNILKYVLEKGDRVNLLGFGSFYQHITKPHKRVNRFSDAKNIVEVPQKTRIHFTLSKSKVKNG